MLMSSFLHWVCVVSKVVALSCCLIVRAYVQQIQNCGHEFVNSGTKAFNICVFHKVLVEVGVESTGFIKAFTHRLIAGLFCQPVNSYYEVSVTAVPPASFNSDRQYSVGGSSPKFLRCLHAPTLGKLLV